MCFNKRRRASQANPNGSALCRADYSDTCASVNRRRKGSKERQSTPRAADWTSSGVGSSEANTDEMGVFCGFLSSKSAVEDFNFVEKTVASRIPHPANQQIEIIGICTARANNSRVWATVVISGQELPGGRHAKCKKLPYGVSTPRARRTLLCLGTASPERNSRWASPRQCGTVHQQLQETGTWTRLIRRRRSPTLAGKIG